MKRETRANLIFLTAFLLLALPGIVILFRKNYERGGRDPAMRLPVRGEWAYMDPTPQIRDLPRTVPPGIGRFTRAIGDRLERMQSGLKSIVGSDTFTPVMSKELGLQLLGYGSDGQSFHVGLLAWNSKYAPLPSRFTLIGKRGSSEIAGEMSGYEPMTLPIELRTELQEYGYILPPDSLQWMIVSFPGPEPVDSIRVHFTLDKTVIDDELKIPTTRPAS